MNVGNRKKINDFFKNPFEDKSNASEITVVSPYISRGALEDVLSNVGEVDGGPDITIICSWRTSDLVSGASDIAVYELCRERGWRLFVNHDESPRKIHLKAYIARYYLGGKTVGRGMIGSANLTNSGLDSNIEYLHPISTGMINLSDEKRGAYYFDWLPGEQAGLPTLSQALTLSFENSLEVNDETYASMNEHLESIGPREREVLPNWVHPEQTHEATLSSLAQSIIDKMPPKISLKTLLETDSIEGALYIRGLRFGQMRKILRDILPKSTTREVVNQKTNEVIEEILESNNEFDIQKRYGTNCLVWKVHPILNEEIMCSLRPYLGKPLRDLGLEEELWASDTLGSKTLKISEVCTRLLPIEISACVRRLSTWQGTLRLTKGDKALYTRPFGERLQFTTNGGDLLSNVSPSTRIDSLLPEKRIRHELWLPAFCLFEAPKGATLGDAILRGYGVWESGREFVAAMERDFDRDIDILSEQSTPFFENPFRKSSETEVCHTKVAAQGGMTGFPLGHPQRPMSRYLNTSSLTDIARDILVQDY